MWHPTRIQLLVARAAAVLVSAVVGAAIVEGAMRLIYHTPWWEGMIEDHRVPWDERMEEEIRRNLELDYSKNRLGLRDRDYAVEKPQGYRRVVIFGDSFTFGVGVSRDHTFAEILERQLNEETTAVWRGVEVLNAGLSGSRTGRWLQIWDEVADQFEPDLVLIVFFLRDGARTSALESFHWPIAREIVIRNRSSLLYEHLYIYRRVRDYLDRAAIGTQYSKAIRDAYLGGEDETEEWRIAQENLRKLRDSARDRSAEVGFVVFPILADLNEGYPFREVCELLEQFAVANDLAVHSLLPAFLGEDGPTLWVSPLDQHPNERAHAIAAESLLPFVRGLLAQNAGSVADLP